MTANYGSAKKVIHVCRSPVGGLFRHVRDLIGGQAEAGLQVGLICDGLTGGPAAERVIGELDSFCGLGIARLPMRRAFHWQDFAVVRAAAKVLLADNPDIVHGHGAKGGAYGRLLARRVGARAVYTPHGGSLHFSASTPAGLLYLGLERVLKRYTDGIVFESRFSADAYAQKIGRIRTSCAVIHNGLHAREFAPLPQGDRQFDFVFVGELRKLKGIDILLEATRRLQHRRNVSVLIVGAGPDEDYFASRIAALGLASAVKIVPPVYPATQAFARGHCVVVPSLAESLPYVILEAAAAGIPIIASRVGGIPEIFGQYDDKLVSAGKPDALADAMHAVVDDPQAASTRAAGLQARVAELFRVENMIEATNDFYDRLLANRASAS